MELIVGFVTLSVMLALLVVQIGGSIASLFFGRKLPWIWFALAVLEVTTKVLSVALYRETDELRAGVALAGAALAAVLALLVQRRFPGAVMVLGGFLAAGLSAIQVLGPLLNPAPQWLVIGFLAAAGIAGAYWAHAKPVAGTIVLSALIGAGILTDPIVSALSVEEALRFQVYAVLALAGIGFQFWQLRRVQRRVASSPAGGGASA